MLKPFRGSVSLVVAVSLFFSSGALARATEPPDGVREIELIVGSPKSGLPARLSMPSGAGPFAAAVLIHGSGVQGMDGAVGSNTVLRDIAWGLAGRGVAVLRYDKRNFARPQSLLIYGDALTAEQDVIVDAREAIALLRRQEEIDGAKVFVIGHSLGGSLVPRIADGVEPPLAGIVALAGLVRPLPETVLDQVRYGAEVDGTVDQAETAQIAQVEQAVTDLRARLDSPDAAPPSAPFLGKAFAYWKDLDDYDAPATAANLGMPALIVQGGRDYQVTEEDLRLWKAGLAMRKDACFVYDADLDHLLRSGEGPSRPVDYFRFSKPVDATLLDDLAAWLLNRECPVRDEVEPSAPSIPDSAQLHEEHDHGDFRSTS